ncbi:MAG: hypothetical protein QME45_04690 [Clostridiales bacterium]|nr:hypothetical protein [Clostridiales bacterium]
MKSISKAVFSLILAALLLIPAGYAFAATPQGQSSDVVKMTGNIYVNEGTKVDGDVVAFSGNIYVNGTVTGNTVALFGNIYVNGTVDGDATTITGKINIGQNGKVFGRVVEAIGQDGGTFYKVNPGFRVFLPWSGTSLFSSAGSMFISFLFTVAFFLLMSLIYVIMPDKVQKMADTIENRIGKRAGIGLLVLLGSPVAMILITILLAITIVGMILVPFIWLAYLVAALIALVPVYICIGQKTGQIVAKSSIKGFGALAVGVFTIWIINVILRFGGWYTQWFNIVIGIAIFVIGMGTLIDYIASNRKSKAAYAKYPPQGGDAGQNDNASYGSGPANYGKGQNDNGPKDNNGQ